MLSKSKIYCCFPCNFILENCYLILFIFVVCLLEYTEQLEEIGEATNNLTNVGLLRS